MLLKVYINSLGKFHSFESVCIILKKKVSLLLFPDIYYQSRHFGVNSQKSVGSIAALSVLMNDVNKGNKTTG